MENSTIVSFTTFETLNATEQTDTTVDSTDGSSITIFSILFSLSVLTVLMNALILRAFHIEKKLRTYANQYILNITISDLLVGFIMAIRSTVNIYGKWIFGDIVGHVYLGIQNSVLGVSVLGIMAIGFDRYFATFYPILHYQRKKKRIAHIVNGITWVVAFSFWFPMTTIWNLIQPDHSSSEKGFLWVNYGRNFYSSIAVTIARFFIPIVIITALYLKIFLQVKASGSLGIRKRFTIRNISGAIPKTSTQYESETTNDISLTESHDQGLENVDGARKDIKVSRVQTDDDEGEVGDQQVVAKVGKGVDVKDSTTKQSNNNMSKLSIYDGLRGKDQETPPGQSNFMSGPPQETSTNNRARLSITKDNRMKPSHPSSSNNQKVMRTLTFITVAFFLSWLPSSIAIIALDSKSKYAGVTEFVRWASYSNSLINPITYAIAQPLFRQTIWRILRCR